jgi:hypothetical protein
VLPGRLCCWRIRGRSACWPWHLLRADGVSARVAGGPIFRGVPGLPHGRCDLGRLLAGESDAGDRRERRCRNADQCCRSLGAVDWGATPGVGAWGQHQAAEGASERERDAADDLVEAHRARRLPFWGDGQDDSGHGEREADANTANATRTTTEPPPRRTSATIRSRRRGVSLPDTNPALRTAQNHASYKGAEPEAVAGITHSGPLFSRVIESCEVEEFRDLVELR